MNGPHLLMQRYVRVCVCANPHPPQTLEALLPPRRPVLSVPEHLQEDVTTVSGTMDDVRYILTDLTHSSAPTLVLSTNKSDRKTCLTQTSRMCNVLNSSFIWYFTVVDRMSPHTQKVISSASVVRSTSLEPIGCFLAPDFVRDLALKPN